MDLPCSGVYRFGELFRFELPRQFDSYDLLIKSLARFLTLKGVRCYTTRIHSGRQEKNGERSRQGSRQRRLAKRAVVIKNGGKAAAL
ncbi:hypothetical protein BC938DRAFT_473506 [Jimgerdemannia flammicorona]|uniref:Uncharacterized protein n=1 Tax=Jimgerdemannia flammicorona TaxID=994334 RepID=A0A433Q413_9FUNG|nr:hypothetical protein BC938DRAFT_473506 [Jimgerdemannia flammicorona]